MLKWMQMLAVAVVFGFGTQTGVSAADAKKPDEKKPAPAEEKKKDPKDMNADEANAAGLCPVCKKEIKPVYHYDYKNKTYIFASRNCQKEFAGAPEKFGAKGEVKADGKEMKK
jgi:YHS domain-containing protein